MATNNTMPIMDDHRLTRKTTPLMTSATMRTRTWELEDAQDPTWR
eukprot:CAMPEP_0172617692 /NCGR_PEP_ID=MMETSP1068-20121228/71349_1 /TAXON_ID=35684 /ORGANISM="Pseudopedinella elastica, Strain CCMP716" /LENGTH=44 /DNA_ID= /DNA_START= /DNA_END= /DNA_ORIENTATION=